MYSSRMARKRGKLDYNNEASEVIKRHRSETTGWKKERLLAIKLLLEGELGIEAVSNLVGRHRNSINDWIKLFRNGGIEALLKRGEGSGRKGKMTTEAKSELTEKLKVGEFRTAGQAQAWLKEKHQIEFGTNSIYYQLGKLGGRLKVARPSHLKKDEQAASAFKVTLAENMKELELPAGRRIKLWIYDEMRYGLHPLVRRVWSLKGVRVVTPVERRFEWGYVFGAFEVGGGASEFLYSPTVNKEADIHFLHQIAASDQEAMHVVIGDGAGFHHRNGGSELPENLKIITLPAYSPELNPVEKFWDIVKDTICNKAWPSLEALEEKITITLRNYWEDTIRVLSLFTNSYLRSELNDLKKPIRLFQ